MNRENRNSDSIETIDLLTPEEMFILEQRLKSRRIELIREIEQKEEILLHFNHVDLSNQAQIDEFTHTWGINLKDLERIADIILGQRRYLDQIQRALHRIRKGTYGICSMTGRPIERSRLWKFPHTALCEEALNKEENWENGYATI